MIGTRAGSGSWIATAVALGAACLAGCGGGGATSAGVDAAAGTDAADGGLLDQATDGPANDGPAAGDTSEAGAGADAADAGVTQLCKPPASFADPAAMLSATGCVDPTDPTKLASTVIPYEVQSPVWADGAQIRRGFALPDGQQIHVLDCAAEPDACLYGPEDTGKWMFPVGTVMVQSFLYDGKLVDTRLLIHQSTTVWAGYAYQWSESQADATQVSGERMFTFNTGTRTVPWHIPAQLDCLSCHAFASGGTLGTETAQLNRVVGGMNQIDRWKALGLFDGPVPTPYKAALVTPYTGQAGSPPVAATVEQRSRSYLHVNCSPCHRPGGDYANLDLRNDVAFADTHTCGLSPSEGALGVTASAIFKPADPSSSIMWLRMKSPPGDNRMPKLGSDVVDQTAVDLIGSWITSVTTCP